MTNIQKDFFSKPITRYVGERAADLRGADLALFIDALNNNVENLKDIPKDTFFHWFTYALHCAVKSSDADAIDVLVAITIRMINQEPGALKTMFQKSADGMFAGQSFFYVWMNNYYSLVYEKHASSLLALDKLFNKLLEIPGFKFCSMLVKENEGKGSEVGKNPLLVLLRALHETVNVPNNQEKTTPIAELFHKCMHVDPEIMAAALPKELTRSVLFKDKSNLYVLCSTLLRAGRHDTNLVAIIQDALLLALDKNPQPFLSELYKIIEKGPHQGLSSLHLILLTLVEAAYINDNSVALAQLMTIISQLEAYQTPEEKEASVLMLLEPIKTGEYAGLNGMIFLTRALIAGHAHNLSVEPIAKQIEHLIQTAPAAKLLPTLKQYNPASSTPEYTISPLMQLVKQLEHNEPAAIPSYLINILNSIPIGLRAQLNAGLPQSAADKLDYTYAILTKGDSAKKKTDDNSPKVAENAAPAQYKFFKEQNKTEKSTNIESFPSPSSKRPHGESL